MTSFTGPHCTICLWNNVRKQRSYMLVLLEIYKLSQVQGTPLLWQKFTGETLNWGFATLVEQRLLQWTPSHIDFLGTRCRIAFLSLEKSQQGRETMNKLFWNEVEHGWTVSQYLHSMSWIININRFALHLWRVWQTGLVRSPSHLQLHGPRKIPTAPLPDLSRVQSANGSSSVCVCVSQLSFSSVFCQVLWRVDARFKYRGSSSSRSLGE